MTVLKVNPNGRTPVLPVCELSWLIILEKFLSIVEGGEKKEKKKKIASY